MDATALINRYAAGERRFGSAALSGANLAGQDLSAIDLSGAALDGADLSGARLDAAILAGANLRSANLNGARLRGARLPNSDLTNADLGNCDLRGANLLGCALEGARTAGALRDGALFPNADRWRAAVGSNDPLGATWIDDESAWNFALYSANATRVDLLLFARIDDTAPLRSLPFDPRRNRCGDVWHRRVAQSDIGTATCYAYSIDGPHDPARGHRFEAAKVLLDPYARIIDFPAAFTRDASRLPSSNAGKAPLARVPTPRKPFDWGDDRRPRHTSDTVIYEMHVRGFTRDASSQVIPSLRGTFAGVVEKIPYLKDLGVTAVELLPIQQFAAEEGGNYWGYMTLGFFAPHAAYCSTSAPDDRADEFRAMVKALHAADIEVILDVVYNHSAEGDQGGPTYGFRGIDNASYYLLDPSTGEYRNDTGTGNTFRTGAPAVRKLIMDSLRYWVTEMHVDGFRFDLASIFTRSADGGLDLRDPPIIAELTGDPAFEGIRLIAEAWDLGSYLLGKQFPGTTWAQWNGRFRDDVRSFVKGDPGRVPDVIRRLYGSDDLFPDQLPDSYHPYQSINLVTCHDGFCLYDLTAYNQKHNQANQHGNTDGTDSNFSWNCGIEGEADVTADVAALRRRQAKNLFALLFLANGTPMFVAGDEFLQTQGGNNNPYNQDNTTTWLDWGRLHANQEFHRFCRAMIAFRKAHPSLSRDSFWRDDVTWYGAEGTPDYSFNSRSIAFHLRPGSEPDDDLCVIANAYWGDLSFALPAGREWFRVVDTSRSSPDDILDPGSEVALGAGAPCAVAARSVVVLLGRPSS